MTSKTKNTIRHLFVVLVGGFFTSCNSGVGAIEKYQYLIACGDEQVFIINPETSSGDTVDYVWQWHVSETKGLPEADQYLFKTIDECKPVGQGDTLLITSSSGGAMLLERRSKEALFYTNVPNAHSIELLPNNRLVVALSYATMGNSIEVYDINKPDLKLCRDSLYSGHGVVWISKQQLLYALGFDQLRAYVLLNWSTDTPQLQLVQTWFLPDEGGHDLISISNDELLLSTHHGVWHFDINSQQFTPFGALENTVDVKSVNYDIATGQLVYTKGEESWWTHHIYMENPEKTIKLPSDFRMYKARTLALNTRLDE